MANDSSTGGYLVPTSTGGDLNDKALAQFLQQVVVNIAGLPGPLVRPRWQAEPPNIPDITVNWCSIGPGRRYRDSYAYVRQSSGGNGSSTVIRNRLMDILCTFYGPGAEQNAEYLAQGFEVPQNREVMQKAGFNIVAPPRDSFAVPRLVKQRWYYAVDIDFTVRQQLQYTFSVLNLTGAQGTLTTDDQAKLITEDIAVNPPA